MRTHLRLTLLSLSVSLALAACGGGGGGSDTAASGGQTGGNNNGSQPGNTGNTGNTGTFPTTTASMVMACPQDVADAGTTEQCSGDIAITADKGNGVLVTNSGVQVIAKSSVDKQTTAEGLALTTDGIAEIRLFKGASTVSKPSLLLNNLGIKWDGTTERPQIIERFLSTQGRTEFGANKVISVVALPVFGTFDATKRNDPAYQSRYANNTYFPRTAPASVCPPGTTRGTAECPAETTAAKFAFTKGNWQDPVPGTDPDETDAGRLHEDGDVSRTPDVPFPGTKGYRDFANYSYRYANVTKWLSQDTVEIAEWKGVQTVTEHTQNRRGIVAFGDVTDSTKIPATGTATYKGWFYGWYASTVNDPNPVPFRAEVTITANFAARTVAVTAVNGTNVGVNPNTPLAALNFTSTTDILMGPNGSNVANYMTGALANGNLKGGLGGRFFGPVETGVGGNGPAEIGASIRMQDSGTGVTLIGGIIAIKRNLP